MSYKLTVGPRPGRERGNDVNRIDIKKPFSVTIEWPTYQDGSEALITVFQGDGSNPHRLRLRGGNGGAYGVAWEYNGPAKADIQDD